MLIIGVSKTYLAISKSTLLDKTTQAPNIKIARAAKEEAKFKDF